MLVAQSCPILLRPHGLYVPLSMAFSTQEYWSRLPFPSPGDLPDPGTEPGSPALEADALTSEPPGKPMFTSLCGHKFSSPLGKYQGAQVLNFIVTVCLIL